MNLRDALILACCLLGLSTAASAAGTFLPRHRRASGLLAGIAALAAALVVASFPLGSWIRWAEVPANWVNSTLLVLAGLCTAAAFLAAHAARSSPSEDDAAASLPSAAGVALCGLLAGSLLLGLDDDLMYPTPATFSPFAVLFLGLHPLATGFLLATVVPAAGLLLSRSGHARPAPWDAAIRRLLHAGLPPLVIALAAEAVWHERIWSAPWSFDLSETWPLLSVLLFVLWFHLRRAAPERPRTASALLVAGGAVHVGYWLYCPLLPTALQSLNWYL